MTETAIPDATAAPASAASAGPLADLILVRLLPTGKTRPSPKTIRADLAGFFRHPPSAEQFDEGLAALRASGLVTPKGQTLTDAGRARALAYLGVSDVPAKANWGTIKARYLVPKALGVSAESVRDGKRFAALLLKRKLGLPVGTGGTLGAVFEAVACRELGYSERSSLKELMPVLLGRAVGSADPVSVKDAEKLLPRVLLGAKKGGMDGLRSAALEGFADGESPPAVEPEQLPPLPVEEFDLETFANTVRAAARTCPTGRFGDNKVFISHVWRQLADEPRFAPLGLAGFKVKLIEANREDLLTLSRADLVQVMDPADVRDSETEYLNAAFHFVLVEKG